MDTLPVEQEDSLLIDTLVVPGGGMIGMCHCPGAGSTQNCFPPANQPAEDTACECGSIIDVQNQLLGEALPVTGTPYRLYYSSGRSEWGIDRPLIVNSDFSALISPSNLPSAGSIVHLFLSSLFFHKFIKILYN